MAGRFSLPDYGYHQLARRAGPPSRAVRWRVDRMPIERTPSGGYIATVRGFPRVEVPLPSPDQLKADAIAVLLSSGDPVDGEAAGMLHQCDLAYDVAFGDDGEELI